MTTKTKALAERLKGLGTRLDALCRQANCLTLFGAIPTDRFH
jgi:hypothetical protein